MPIQAICSTSIQAPAITNEFVRQSVASRLAASDPTLWGEAASERAATRLGWIRAIERIDDVIERCLSMVESFTDVPYSRVLLCGMGGSSLAPQVFASGANIPLIPVDTVHPDAVDTVTDPELLRESLVVVSSKSGVTAETRAQLSLIEARFAQAGVAARERIIVITDPGSDLAQHAQQLGYRVALADPTVGGRYAALIEFGLLPAALVGVDLSRVAADAQQTLARCAADSDTNPMLQVAAALASYATRGITVQAVEVGHPLLPAWIEQLIAESTGHEGQGLLPIPRALTEVSAAGGPVIVLTSGNDDASALAQTPDVQVHGSLAAQFVFWELVTAAASIPLGVNPFEQPDVERTKAVARSMRPEEVSIAGEVELAPDLRLIASATPWSADLGELSESLLREARSSRYVVIQAFTASRHHLLHDLARVIEQRTGVATTVSYGPQYLHSTGQLHKGGPAGGLFICVVSTPSIDLPVPASDTSFRWLLESMSRADAQVLEGLGRRVCALRIGNDEALTPLLDGVRASSTL